MEVMGRMLMGLGALLFLMGAALAFGGRLLPLGRLPGDIVIQKGNFTFYFPVVTSILVSIGLSLLFWVLGRLGGR